MSNSIEKFNVLILDNRHKEYGEECKILNGIGARVTVSPTNDEEEICRLVRDIDGLIVNLAPITANVIASMKKCRCVSRYGVGYDNIDVDALMARGIAFANVQDFCSEDVADHTLALWMDCVRKISRKDRLIRQGKWNLINVQKCYRVSGKTYGMVGCGRIGGFLRHRLKSFDLKKVVVWDPYKRPKQAYEQGIELVDIETLCRESDYISIHVPLVPSTRGMIGDKFFSMMKPTAILINTSRGPILDQKALVRALKSRTIACAGLDVFEKEPLPQDSELLSLENVTLCDHEGWYSEESLHDLKIRAGMNIAEFLTGKRPKYLLTL
jgi:D-3-phosphoglycerate dehydrogenase